MKSNRDTAKIDGFVLTGLLVNLVSTTAVLFVPLTISKIAGHDGWIASLIASLSGVYIVYILIA